MATKNEENWMMHYNELKAYVAVHYHFPDKHKVEVCGLLNWCIGSLNEIFNTQKYNHGKV